MTTTLKTVVCWRWFDPDCRSRFSPETVHVMRNMVRRHYPHPHRFLCVTDAPKEIDSSIETFPLWPEFRDLKNPHGAKNPNCYPRLKAFSAEIESVFGNRFVSVDLDAVILGDLTPLWNRSDDFIIWEGQSKRTWYNGSMFMMNAGARSQVWTLFNPKRSPSESKNAGYWGSDQGWISHCLGLNETRWSKADGIYSYRLDIRPQGGRVPANARIVFHHGEFKPWSPGMADRYPWIREHYV